MEDVPEISQVNNSKVLEVLRDGWAIDRRAEWSIWMLYSKVEIPHHYISSFEDSSYHSVRGSGRAPNSRKLTDDVRVFPMMYMFSTPYLGKARRKLTTFYMGILVISLHSQTAAVPAELHRRSIAQMRINSRLIQDMHIFEDPSRIPIILVERVVNAPLRSSSGSSYLSNHDHRDLSLSSRSRAKAVKNLSGDGLPKNGRVLKIVVFVHGFQGHHLDLWLVKNQCLMIDPKAEFLMSEVNEEKTSGDFTEMRHRLAQEVISFVKKKMDKISRSGGLCNIKLSSVGHSIGNVIIRTTLSEIIMESYLRFLYTYVSISGPHLGYLYSSNSLFYSGLWLLKKLKGTRCVHQLTLTDNPDLQKTFIFKLCKLNFYFRQKTLDNFRNIILLLSPQDGYVPYHSARIEPSSIVWRLLKKGVKFSLRCSMIV